MFLRLLHTCDSSTQNLLQPTVFNAPAVIHAEPVVHAMLSRHIPSHLRLLLAHAILKFQLTLAQFFTPSLDYI